MTQPIVAGARRIVTYVDSSGRSRMLPGHHATRAVDYAATPGMRTSVLWATAGAPMLDGEPVDPVPALPSVHPAPGGSVFLTLTLPPEHVYAAPSFDPVAAAREQLGAVPGIAERMEPDAPGFHRTDSLDYVVVLLGDVWLVLDEGEVCLHAGDAVVQGGARHAWQNRGDQPATLAVVLLGTL